MLQVRLDDGTSLIKRDNFDLKYELGNNKSLVGFKVISNALDKIIKKRKKANFAFLIHQIEMDD